MYNIGSELCLGPFILHFYLIYRRKYMDFNKAKTSKIFFKYIIPQIIELFFNSIYFIVDGIFIGNRLGSEVLAAVGVAVPLVSFTYAISMLIAIGAGVRISIFKGQGKPEK